MIDNDSNKTPETPENDPAKAMNSEREVSESPDPKTDQDFPGYPHYPANEDIMHQSTGSHQVDADLENSGTGPNAHGVSQRFVSGHQDESSQTNRLHNNDGLDGNNDEIGLPHNVANEDLNSGSVPGTDIDEAAEKGSTNP